MDVGKILISKAIFPRKNFCHRLKYFMLFRSTAADFNNFGFLYFFIFFHPPHPMLEKLKTSAIKLYRVDC